jgi:radical SAM protein with 4Fe4S-binding SPASM domain
MFFYYLLTQQCNLACGHCIRGKSESIHMPTDDAIRGMNKLSNYDPNGTLVLTGGEPTLHPNFMELVQHALKCFKEVILTSNGTTPLYMDNINTWIDLHTAGLQIQFSIDGDEQAHDRLRGRGSWRTAMNHLEYLSQAGIHMWCSTVVTKDNINSIPSLREHLHCLRIQKWHVSPVLPFGCGVGLKGLSVCEWNTFVDDMLDNCRMRLGIRRLYDFTQLDKLSNKQIRILSQEISEKKSNHNCGSGNTKLYIYPNFFVYGCTCLSELPFGCLKNESIQSILQSQQAQQICDYHVDENSPCRKCRYLPLCNGGCIGMSFHKMGRIGMGDMRCPLWQKNASEGKE